MARDDLPSMIYYILNVTQQTQIGYVGHSQGTLIAFAEFGRPNSVLQDSVSFYAALAPVAHLGHIKSPIKYLSSTSKELELYWHLLFGRNEFLPSSYLTKWLGTFACGEFIIDRLLCQNILFVLCGPENKNMNNSRMPVYLSHEPDGTSVKNMIHYAQGVQTNIFRAYDYGSPQKNQLHYNQTTPPEYNILAVKIPTAIFWSSDDWLADAIDVAYIFDNLQNIVYEKYVPGYNHLDFVWAISANKLIYSDLLNSKGYPWEEHKVTTADGYILGVFHVPHGRNPSSLGRPVLLQHGLLDSATSWVINFPEQSLGFILADAGYDVWLGNMRGNHYSRAHVKYNPDHDEAFWDFSWDDMARDDLPSMIYYILNQTKQTQIGYVGHSQGTMVGFAEFGNLNNSAQNNVSLYGSLAPVAHLAHIKSPLKYLFNTSTNPEEVWHTLCGYKDFLPSSYIIK
ncbi:unnamed protein product [Rotaria magnacalcarata]|uniref:Triacylglycerol lipase n=2 Tax=Rotaria magnacalcarata TaxID=392030 RepID=A0A8S3BMS0_9BILA|nr:unnamed protein product [Rotaria magnacalcarata]